MKPKLPGLPGKSVPLALFAGTAVAILYTNPVMAGENAEAQTPDRIVVIAEPYQQADVPGSAQYLDADLLQKQAFSDVLRILRAVPGVNIQEEDGFGLRPNIGLRGSGMDRSGNITLMEDGVLIAPAPYAAPEAYYFPAAARMSAMEIIKGAAGIKYGPRTQGGSINLVSTPIPATDTLLADVQAGSFGSRQLLTHAGGTIAAAPTGASISGLFEVLQRQSDGFKQLPGGGNTGYGISDVVGKLRLQNGDNAGIAHSLEFKLQASWETSHETYLGLTAEDFERTPYARYAASANDKMQNDHRELSARYRADFHNGFDFTLLGYDTRFHRDWFKLDRVDAGGSLVDGGKSGVGIADILADPASRGAEMQILRGEAGFVSASGALLNKHNNRSYGARGVQVILGWRGTGWGMEHDLELSVRVHEDEMDRFQWWDRYTMVDGQLVLSGADTPGTESNRIDTARAVSVYAQDHVQMGRWTLVPGIRVEQVDLMRTDWGRSNPDRTGAPASIPESTISSLIPGLGVIWSPDSELSLFAGIHRGFAPPAPGNATAKAETATNWELGARWQRGSNRLEATGFFNAYGNMLGTVTQSTGGSVSIGTQFNGGKVRVAGMEIAAETDLLAGHAIWSAPLRISATYTQATFQSSFLSAYEPWGRVETGDRVPGIAPLQFSAAAGLENGVWGAEAVWHHQADIRTRAGTGGIAPDELIPARSVVDASLWWQAGSGLRLSAMARNLGDETYLASRNPAGLRPGLPRTFMFGIQIVR